MTDVFVVGAACSRFGRFEGSLVEEAARVVVSSLEDAAIASEQIDALYVGNYLADLTVHQSGIASLIARDAGVRDAATTRVEGICTSGSIAFAHAVAAVRAGTARAAIAVGVEVLSTVEREARTKVIGLGFDQKLEGRQELSFAQYFGLVARAYMSEFALAEPDLGAVSAHNHFRGAKNPVVSRPLDVTPELYQASPIVADPLRALDCCGAVDGASAVVVTTAKEAAPRRPVRVAASVQTSGPGSVSDLVSLTSFSTVTHAARRALDTAGISISEIDVVEVHDAFTISQIIDLEDLGFFEKGRGLDFLEKTDSLYVNPSGGLLARGHPIGATGVAQVYELVRQLRGESHYQHPSAGWAMAQTVGGIDAFGSVTVLSGG